MTEFTPFPKVPRLHRDIVVTEKLDGTNASVHIEWVSHPENPFAMESDCFMAEAPGGGYLAIAAGSRTRFVTPDADNFGFARWVQENVEELAGLGEGVHYGEWWGGKIQRGYGLKEKRFSLFNVGRWVDAGHYASKLEAAANGEIAPTCCHVVPVLYRGLFSEYSITRSLEELAGCSRAAPEFENPEGVMIYHTAANQYFKKTFEGDAAGKEAAKG